MSKWKMAAVQDRACRNKDISAALITPPPPRPHIPTTPTTTPGTLEAIRPSHLDEVVLASSFRGKAALKFTDSSREDGVALGREFLPHFSEFLSKLVVPSA
jgi:hypothetical protein